MNRLSEYREFLLRKSVMAADKGFAVLDAEINPILKPHQRRTVQWLVAGGRRGAFAKFGLGKTVMQIEACRITLLKCGGKRAMITAPLGVRQEFIRDAHTLATGESPHVTDAQREELRAWQAAGPGRVPSMNFIRSIEEAAEPGIYLTNFETIRDGKLDPGQFEVCSLDEASVLRGFGGTKTFREFMRLYESVQYRFVATAIPDPNETIELLAYAAFLGVMDVGQAKTRFFKRNSEKADQLTLHVHKEREFWMWVATWGLFLQKPSDICECVCHLEKRLKVSGSENSQSNLGSPEQFATEHGPVGASADKSSSQPQPGYPLERCEVADVSERPTALKDLGPTVSGAECGIDATEGTIRTGLNTVAGESRYVNAGDDSVALSPISETLPPQPPSNAETTTATMSPETAIGPQGKRRLGTPGEQSLSPSKEEPNLSQPGQKSSGQTTGDSTAAISSAGLQNECLRTCCDKCRCDDGYSLPQLDIRWHEVAVDHANAPTETSGQHTMFRGSVKGVVEASREKRDTLGARVAKMGELLAAEPEDHFLLWHDLEAERAAIEKVLGGSDGEGMVHMAGDVSGQKGVVLLDRSRSGKAICDTERSKGSDRAIRKSTPRISGVQVEGDPAGVKRWASVYGTQDLDEREQAIIDFSDGRIQYLAAKPVIAGSGCNFQRHCAREIFVGIGFKFNDFIQAVHRCYRFLQSRTVVVHIIYAESEREIKADLLRKWAQYDETVANMAEIIRQYGLDHADMMSELARSIGVERTEVVGDRYLVANNDCVEETMSMEADSVDMVLTSIPFSTQYEYTPSYNDFGHTDNNEHFFEQMDFLTPELLRVMKPGRVAAIHVKDRIVPGGMTGLGFQSVYPFHARVIEHFTKHGFAYMGMKTIVTDVVRENNQTYRLGYTEMCKDASKIGVGMPEYLLLFRKPQTDRTKGYADDRVVKERYGAEHSLARWQVKASGFDRSSGDRLLDPEELRQLDHQAIFKLFKHYSLTEVYNFEHHVRIGEALAEQRRLPSDFALLQPASHSPEVWDDITRMQTMNAAQSAKGREMHLCPMQFDIADRAIEQYTNEGDVVYDPFGGLMTTPVRALKLRRRGRAAELNPGYFGDGCTYLRITEMEMSTPTLFDLLAVEEEKECELA